MLFQNIVKKIKIWGPPFGRYRCGNSVLKWRMHYRRLPYSSVGAPAGDYFWMASEDDLNLVLKRDTSMFLKGKRRSYEAVE
jgi:hypothetical protein